MSTDLDILHPERELEIAGETVVVREFGFIEAARLSRWAQPVIDDLAQMMMDPDVDIDLTVLDEILTRHTDVMTRLIAQAVDRDPAWVEALSDVDGQRLMMAFWEVNGGFFMRRLVMQAVTRQPLSMASVRSTPH